MVLWLLCSGLWAQTQQSADPATLARVEGRVVNAVTGEPLRKTELLLQGAGGEFMAVSDGSGHFAIERVAPGSYKLTAQHQNYSILEYGAPRPSVPGKRISLTAGQSVTGIELKMVPFGVISGKVVDQDGDPVTGLPIVVMRWGFMRGGRQLQPSGGGTSTNDRGEYRIYNLASGRYFVVARPIHTDVYAPQATSGRTVVTASRIDAYASTFYPSAPDAASASQVAVNAGQEVPGVDIQLRKTRVYTVQGKVNGTSKGRRYSISMQPADALSSGNFGMGRAAQVRPEDGTFTFRGVAPGRYTLIVNVDNRVGARQDFALGDNDVDGLVVTIMEPGAVKGRVLMESGAPKGTLKGLRISLTPVDGIPMNLPNANSGDDGSFTMEDVSADRYKVNCSPMQDAYLKTIRWGGQVSNDGTVDMSAGGSATLELVFAPTSAVIDGDVKGADDQPVTGTPVLLSPSSGRETDFRIVTTDQSGHFSAKGVAPGGYVAVATDAPIYSMPDAALLKALEKVTTQVNVDENGHTTTSLKFVPEASIEALQ